jgi:hypothetical protein
VSAHVQPARKLRQQRLCARSARGGKEKALHRKLCGEAHWGATYTCGRKCENALELQGGHAPAESPDPEFLGPGKSISDTSLGLASQETVTQVSPEPRC